MRPRRSSLRAALPWLLFWVGLTLFFATQSGWISALTDRRAPSFWLALLAHAAHWLSWGALSLVVFALARRYPISGRVRLRHTFLHLLGALVIGSLQLVVLQAVVHTARVAAGHSPLFVAELRREFGDFFHLNLLTYGLLLAAAAALDSQRRAGEQRLLAARLAEQLADAKRAALQMQVHPHFLFNSLHTAAELVHENPSLAERTLLRLADLLRRSLHESAREEVSLAESLEFVDSYLELEGVRLEGRLRARYDIPEDLLAATLPAMLLQPLVENAVRHGVARRRGGGEIAIAAWRRATRLTVEIANDLPDCDAPPMHAGAGIGLANVRARLGHRYGSEASLTTAEADGRFLVRVTLPTIFGTPFDEPRPTAVPLPRAAT